MKTLGLMLLVMLQTSPARPQEVGVITGLISTSEGKPAASVRVFARISSETSRDKSTIDAQVVTDADGRYRLEIRPGRYFIGTGYVEFPTWYPGATDFAAAKPVHVSVNETIAIDINSQYIPMNGSLQVQVMSAMGLPLRNATATLTGIRDRGPVTPGQPQPYIPSRPATEQTDGTGIVVFRNLTPGRYIVTTAFPGYIANSMVVELGPDGPGPRFQWKLVPDIRISGFVKDTSGKPVRTEVWAGRIQERDGHREFVRMVSELTDDQGHYILVPPEPGSYFLAAQLPKGLSGLDITYYPGTRQLDEALPLTVLNGETLGGIELLVPLKK